MKPLDLKTMKPNKWRWYRIGLYDPTDERFRPRYYLCGSSVFHQLEAEMTKAIKDLRHVNERLASSDFGACGWEREVRRRFPGRKLVAGLFQYRVRAWRPGFGPKSETKAAE